MILKNNTTNQQPQNPQGGAAFIIGKPRKSKRQKANFYQRTRKNHKKTPYKLLSDFIEQSAKMSEEHLKAVYLSSRMNYRADIWTQAEAVAYLAGVSLSKLIRDLMRANAAAEAGNAKECHRIEAKYRSAIYKGAKEGRTAKAKEGPSGKLRRRTTILNGEQVQAIEYEKTAYGISASHALRRLVFIPLMNLYKMAEAEAEKIKGDLFGLYEGPRRFQKQERRKLSLTRIKRAETKPKPPKTEQKPAQA